MAFEEGSEMLTCPACGAMYMARWSRMPVRDYQKIDCKPCGGVLVQGKSVRDYFAVTPISG